ncbi:NAD(P)/FAD-dependent oxidoreductase [Dokdonia sp. Hel_I_53]|uniref:NAD(P)/FAD-dependent oxidoreductase n=1 Tax=Dokdonia sp. Hel_I_53 TaxID=1566287 RepID=UPI00119BF594|nr:NAD(P)/FAD-dependent oxidoreductase [Dokdonia sp. Hel_I_53]TVZ51697.1 flavin-dependent dehydrogenase [Dokdonia sp. Hel_I_53]
MISKRDIIIVGGGLAGLTAAIHLQQKRCSVTLIERQNYPKHKVCGEYVSNEVLPYIRELGIYPLKNGAKDIREFQFSGLSGKALSIQLPLGGFGMSRYALDHLMLQRAIALGVEVVQKTVEKIGFQDKQFKVEMRDTTLYADYVLGAYGKRSGLDVTLSRKFIKERTPWMGVKMHYEAAFPDDVVALHNFEGGYCGLSKVETEAVNVCYLTNNKTFKKFKDLAEFQKEILEQNAQLKSFFSNAKPIFNKPIAISQISFENKSTIEDHILMIGDSAGLIHPLCGNGMAMAIHSAKIASECLLYHFENQTSRQQLEINYTKRWKKAFTQRMRNGALIQRGLYSKTLTRVGVQLLQKSPLLLKKIISSTHGKPLSDEF